MNEHKTKLISGHRILRCVLTKKYGRITYNIKIEVSKCISHPFIDVGQKIVNCMAGTSFTLML